MTEPEVVLPGQHEVGAGVVGPRPCGAPLDGVDLLTVGLQVVDTRVLLHAPDLEQTDRLLVGADTAETDRQALSGS